MTDAAERLRLAIYRSLATTGVLPDRDALAALAEVEVGEFDGLVAELAAAHHLGLRDGRIVLAHPFATESFGFSVMSATTLWCGGCCWDAFAIPNLVPGASPSLVATTCPACGTPHAWVVGSDGPPEGDQVAHFLTPTDAIWPDVVHACANQQVFCSEEHVDDWVRRTGVTKGYVTDLATLWRLASRWYEGRLDTPYERREPVEAADYFRSVGLTGPFWGLPAEPAGTRRS